MTERKTIIVGNITDLNDWYDNGWELVHLEQSPKGVGYIATIDRG